MKFIVLGFLLLPVFSLADSRWGIQGGINLANVSSSPSIDTSMRSGFAAGISYEVSFMNVLYLEPALMYVQRGYVQTVGATQTTNAVDYVELPILLKIKLGFLLSFEVFAGPSVGLLISKPSTLSLKTLDSGLHLGGGANFDLGSAIGAFISARYVMGMTDINQSVPALNNNGWMLLAGLRF